MASINRGDNTRAFGGDFLRIYLNNPNNLEITKAVFQVNGDFEKEFIDPIFPLRINFSGEETYKLHQMNVCKLALWDSHGRRRTADGKFTFFVKQNMVREQDSPDDYEEEAIEDNSITFNLDDAEFLAKFEMNVSPSKMSELEQDLHFFSPDNIKNGANISVIQDGEDVIISADLQETGSYPDLTDKPKINGIELVGDIEIETAVNADWNETDPEEKSYIRNKPQLADIAFSGSYNDLTDIPEGTECPTKVSQLENDENYVKNTELNQYYNKLEVNTLIQNNKTDLTDVNTQLESVTNAVNSLGNRIDNKVDTTDLTDLLEDKADKVNVENALQQLDDKKLNANLLGTGKLNIAVNGTNLNGFSANATRDMSVNIEVPTKVSQLENDENYVTADEVSLDTLATKTEVQNALNHKVDNTSLGDGQLIIRKNGVTISTFSANTKLNSVADIIVPQNVSELSNDANYICSDDLSPIQANIDALQSDLNDIPAALNLLQSQINKKVDKEANKGLISQAEIDRISSIQEYNDAELRDLISQNTNDITDLTAEVNSKVDKIVGKQLSTNDFTDLDKAKLDNASSAIGDIQTSVNAHAVETNVIKSDISTLTTNVDNLSTNLSNETQARQDKDIFLQEQIDGLAAKSMVVDIVADLDELDNYDTTTLKNKDIISVLCDDSKRETTTYYRYMNGTFIFVGSEGEKYTKAQADNKFVPQTRTINGKPLTEDITLNYISVDAMPASRVIGNGRLTIQKNTVELGVFDADQTDNKTINIPIPEKYSDLIADIEYVEQDTFDVETNRLQSDINSVRGKAEANSASIASLRSIISGEDSTLPAVALSGDYNDLSNRPTIPDKTSQLLNDSHYVTETDLEITMDDLAKVEDIPDKISQLENDRGYVTTNAIGKAKLTFTINGNPITLTDNKTGVVEDTWMANEKDSKTIDIPVDNTLSNTSTLPVENKVVTNEMSRIDTSAIHKTGDESITGIKTFSNIVATDQTVTNIAITNGTATTKDTTDNSTNIATTAFVKNQDYCTNTNAVHKSQTEEITGQKTFTGKVLLNGETTTSTQANTDNSTKLATTAFVKNQDYCTNIGAVHKTGNETIQGDKTFNDTVEMNGIVRLSEYSHVPTPDMTDEDNNNVDLVANVEFVQSSVEELNTALTSTISGNYNSLNGRLTTAEGNITSINTKFNDYTNTTNMNTAIQAVQNDLNTFKTTVSTTYVTDSVYQTFKSNIEGRISAVENRLDTIEQALITAGLLPDPNVEP